MLNSITQSWAASKGGARGFRPKTVIGVRNDTYGNENDTHDGNDMVVAAYFQKNKSWPIGHPLRDENRGQGVVLNLIQHLRVGDVDSASSAE